MNNVGDEGAKELGPYLAKLDNMATLNMAGVWRQQCFLIGRCVIDDDVVVCVSDVR